MRRVHLVGIGGAGMSGIARLLLARGIAVSGSDAKDSHALAALRALGAEVHVGHAAENIAGASTVVVSTAVRESNPELLAARASGTPVLRRAEALAELLEGYRSVAVAGTHGKTTTTSMLTITLQHCGADPSYAIGGDLTGAVSEAHPGGNAHQGRGDLFVLEADESDGSFLVYRPHAAIVTNIEPDHLDHHGSIEAYEQVFREFADTVSEFVVACLDDPGSSSLLARPLGARLLTYGTTEGADLQLHGLSTRGATSSYEAVLRGRSLGGVLLPVAGAHLARNSAAALLTAVELGMPAAEVIEGLAAFTGVARRMERKGAQAGVTVYDDYAHHPTEVRAQLVAAREMARPGRVIVVFQPHLYSRTATFAEAFGQALGLADEVVVMDVYGAREDPVPGVSGASVAAAIPLPAERVAFEPTWSAVADLVVSRAAPGDLVVTMGAGDVTLLGPEVLALLRERAS